MNIVGNRFRFHGTTANRGSALAGVQGQCFPLLVNLPKMNS
jgi:hypothetical protein